MNIGQMLKLELSKGKSLMEIEKEEYYVTCFVPKTLSLFRNVKPTKVRMKFKPDLTNADAKPDDTFYNVVKNMDMDFKVQDKFDRVQFDKTIRVLNWYVKLLTVSKKGTLTTKAIPLFTDEISENKINGTNNLDVKIFKTIEEATEYYEARKKMSVFEIMEAVDEFKKEIEIKGQILIDRI